MMIGQQLPCPPFLSGNNRSQVRYVSGELDIRAGSKGLPVPETGGSKPVSCTGGAYYVPYTVVVS
jgi:hypothetical protein